MKYVVAQDLAWKELSALAQEEKYTLGFLSDQYDIDLKNRLVLSRSCNVPAKDYLSIVLLHYLIQKIKGLPRITNEWLSFKQLPGGQGYYPTFKKRVIGVIVKKYAPHPEALLALGDRFQAKRTQLADFSVVLEVFEQLPALINFWRGDDEFGPEANLLFDQSISSILCTEDVVVLAEVLAHTI
ncbi:DUF3786 domain-containing protein [Candidatus Omnitrophota bacterium]